MVPDGGGWVSEVSEMFFDRGGFVLEVRKMFFSGSH